MHDEPKTWQELYGMLLPPWRELQNRNGSFADAPWEEGDHLDKTLRPIFDFDREAIEGIKHWLETGVFPPMSSAANRIAELHFYCAIGLATQLHVPFGDRIPPEQPLRSTLSWLLLDAYAVTARNALDCLRTDILGGHA